MKREGEEGEEERKEGTGEGEEKKGDSRRSH